jgi:hypothetical protein
MLHGLTGKFKFHWQFLSWLGLIGLLLYQAWLFYYKMPLSLGPRVIFEPWALRNGAVLFENLVDIHPPLMPWLLVVLGWVIPDELLLAKLVLIGLLSLSSLLTFLVARRFFGNWAGLASAACFVLWAPTFGTGKLWYETFLTAVYLIYLLGFSPSDRPRSYRWWILWGIFGGITVLIKQYAALVFAAFLLWEGITAFSLKRPWRTIIRDILITGLFSFVPVALALICQLIQAGTVDSMIYWLVVYPLSGIYEELGSNPPTINHLKLLMELNLLLLPAIIWLGTLIRMKDAVWRQAGLFFCLLFTAGLTAYPRFSSYHLLPILPVSILISVWIMSILLRSRESRFIRSFSVGIAIAIAGLWFVNHCSIHYNNIQNSQPQVIAEYSNLEPLAGEIRQITGPIDSLYILVDDESTSNLYYFLDCPPPGYWTFHYSWYMLPDVKTKILAGLKESPPEWVVFMPEKWQIDTYAPELLDYVRVNYTETVELTLDGSPVYLMHRIPGR